MRAPSTCSGIGGCDRGADELLPFVSEHPQCLRIDDLDDPVCVDQEHAVGCGFEQSAVVLFRLPERGRVHRQRDTADDVPMGPRSGPTCTRHHWPSASEETSTDPVLPASAPRYSGSNSLHRSSGKVSAATTFLVHEDEPVQCKCGAASDDKPQVGVDAGGAELRRATPTQAASASASTACGFTVGTSVATTAGFR